MGDIRWVAAAARRHGRSESEMAANARRLSAAEWNIDVDRVEDLVLGRSLSDVEGDLLKKLSRVAIWLFAEIIAKHGSHRVANV